MQGQWTDTEDMGHVQRGDKGKTLKNMAKKVQWRDSEYMVHVQSRDREKTVKILDI